MGLLWRALNLPSNAFSIFPFLLLLLLFTFHFFEPFLLLLLVLFLIVDFLSKVEGLSSEQNSGSDIEPE